MPSVARATRRRSIIANKRSVSEKSWALDAKLSAFFGRKKNDYGAHRRRSSVFRRDRI